MKTKDEFIRRWRAHVAGAIALGHSDVRPVFVGKLKDSEELGAKLMSLADVTEQLLSRLYDDLVPKPVGYSTTEKTPPVSGTNGHTTPLARKT